MFEYNAKLDRVVDGDTIDVIVDLGFYTRIKERLRLAGIDTPEIYGIKRKSKEYQKGVEAKNFVERRLQENNNEMIIKTDKVGKYRRWIALIFLEDSKKPLNQELVEQGFAVEV
ncbi:MAG: thermonuclease family protein [Thermoplasmatales archaeon]|nr:thermonuclease family protein [Thermoplasmatales archaeon]